MIKYNHGGAAFVLNVCRLRGSVFPKAISVASPASLICVLIVIFQGKGQLFDFVGDDESITKDNAVWSGFSFLVGFLIVFRTSQSYNRFWDGCTSTHQMRAEWFDGCSSLLAFCRHSQVSETNILVFQNTLVRLFSMLHSAALAEIEDSSSPHIDDVKSFQFDLVDVEGIDAESLKAVKACEAKVELIFQWIQQLIVENINTGVLSIPPPILSRSFQEIANGMVAFHDAMKISQIPFPFPYAQTCDFLLWLHWFVVPFVVSQWCKEPWWAFVFSFIQVFVLWVLNFIAVELENPFGCDANDIDGGEMQSEMNQLLMLLMSPACKRTPRLQPHWRDLGEINQDRRSGLPADPRPCGKSFYQVWRDIDEEEGCSTHVPPKHRISVMQHQQQERESEAMGFLRRTGSFSPWRRVSQTSTGTKHTTGTMYSSSLVRNPSSGAVTNSTNLRHVSTVSGISRSATLEPVAEVPSPKVCEDDQLSSTTLELLASPPLREASEGMPDEPVTTSLPRVVIEARLPTQSGAMQWRDAELNAINGSGSSVSSTPGGYVIYSSQGETKQCKSSPRDRGVLPDTSAVSSSRTSSEADLAQAGSGGLARRIIKWEKGYSQTSVT
mmetsp:Transcript_57622/g.89698  ORF Transcript_57622/g.89698 Transcript_57622/m.89698 type:complete len:610 (+) Transcript_57622:83-1912(+)